MSDRITYAGNQNFKLEDLQKFTDANKDGPLVGGIAGDGSVTLYAADKASKDSLKGFEPMCAKERQDLAALVLYQALEGSYGADVAGKVMQSMLGHLRGNDITLSSELLKDASHLAELAKANVALPKYVKATPPAPVQQKADDQDDKQAASPAIRGKGSNARPRAQAFGNKDDFDHRQELDANDDEVADEMLKILPNNQQTIGKPEADDPEPQAVEEPAPPPPHKEDCGQNVEKAASRTRSQSAGDSTSLERQDQPIDATKRQLAQIDDAAKQAINKRKESQESKAVKRSHRMSLDDLTDVLKQRNINNRAQGEIFLKSAKFGELLAAARNPNVLDRLGDKKGFAAGSDPLDAQAVTKEAAEKAILEAFENYGDFIATLDKAERQQIAVDALRSFLALPE